MYDRGATQRASGGGADVKLHGIQLCGPHHAAELGPRAAVYLRGCNGHGTAVDGRRIVALSGAHRVDVAARVQCR